MMRLFRIAVQFLTILPIPVDPAPTHEEFEQSVSFYPLAGALEGLLSGCVGLLVSKGWGIAAGAMAAVVAHICITGGLHLDGLMDSADGLFSRRNRERMLEIMRDSSVGAMGVLALISVLALRTCFIALIPANHWPVLFMLAGCGSRLGVVWMMNLFPYARPAGTPSSVGASSLVGRLRPSVLARSTFCSACLAVFFGWSGLTALLLAPIVALGFGWWMSRRVGGITGDGMGAGIELAELVVLAAFAT